MAPAACSSWSTPAARGDGRCALDTPRRCTASAMHAQAVRVASSTASSRCVAPITRSGAGDRQLGDAHRTTPRRTPNDDRRAHGTGDLFVEDHEHICADLCALVALVGRCSVLAFCARIRSTDRHMCAGLALDNALFLPQRRSHDRNFVTVVRSFGDGLPSALRVEVLGRAGVQVQAAVSEQRCASLAGDDES